MENNSDPSNEKPPVFGSWKNFYGLVLAVLLILIITFYFITQHYA